MTREAIPDSLSRRRRQGKFMRMDKNQAKLIALDWGTSSLRCYRLGARGKVLEARSLPLGIAQVAGTAAQVASSDARQAFERAFLEACCDWIDAEPGAPLIACGMVGSANGWCEVPYLEVPMDCRLLGETLGAVRTSRDRVLQIVPGLIEHGDLPNVMRGEETQIAGALSAASRHCGTGQNGVLIGLPGTHSKWAFVRESHIEHFETYMTGEVYGALCAHTILGSTMRRGTAPDYDSFERGVHVARRAMGEGCILSTIFSVRTLWLTKALLPEQQPDYLSGLIIGHEIGALLRLEEMRRTGRRTQPPPILLAGESQLCTRYIRALRIYGRVEAEIVPEATERGLWRVAEQAGLVPKGGQEALAKS